MRGNSLRAHDGASVPLVDVEHVAQDVRLLGHDVVAQQHGERLLADVFPCHTDGVTQAPGLALAQVVNVAHVGDLAHLLEKVGLARPLEVVLQFE